MKPPATRLGHWVLYPGGAVFKLKRWPYVLFVLHLKRVAYAKDFVKGGRP